MTVPAFGAPIAYTPAPVVGPTVSVMVFVVWPTGNVTGPQQKSNPLSEKSVPLVAVPLNERVTDSAATVLPPRVNVWVPVSVVSSAGRGRLEPSSPHAGPCQ